MVSTDRVTQNKRLLPHNPLVPRGYSLAILSSWVHPAWVRAKRVFLAAGCPNCAETRADHIHLFSALSPQGFRAKQQCQRAHTMRYCPMDSARVSRKSYFLSPQKLSGKWRLKLALCTLGLCLCLSLILTPLLFQTSPGSAHPVGVSSHRCSKSSFPQYVQ